MERRYPGGFFLAVDTAQRVILLMLGSARLRHVLQHETDQHHQPLGKNDPRGVCFLGSLCPAVVHKTDADSGFKFKSEQGMENAARLGRDVGRLLVLFVQRRPYLVHAFFHHELRTSFKQTSLITPKCGICSWKPKESARCDYCGIGACTTCIGDWNYKSCARGCCRLCVTCEPLVSGNGCAVEGCIQLDCTRGVPQRCQDGGCSKTLCDLHAQKGHHECDGKRRRIETEPGESN